MDRKKSSVFIKVFAGILAFSFILGMVVFSIDAFMYPAGTQPNQTANEQLTEEEVQFDTNARMYKSMAELNTTDTTAFVSLGNTYYDWAIYIMQKKRDFKQAESKLLEAEKAYTQALELDPENLNVMVDLAAVYYYLGKLDESRKLLDQVLAKKPDFPQALFNAGLVARDQKDYSSAASYFKRFIEKYPKDPNVDAAKAILKDIEVQQSTAGAEN